MAGDLLRVMLDEEVVLTANDSTYADGFGGIYHGGAQPGRREVRYDDFACDAAPAVPALPGWALAGMTLLLAAGGLVVFRRQWAAA